jgi:hypothetical protein
VSSIAQQVADAVVAELELGEAGGAFARSIVTERVYDTNLELEDTSIISVLVVPMLEKRHRESGGGLDGGTWIRDVRLEIIVRKRYAQSDYTTEGKIDKTSVDPFIELLEQIDDYLANPNQQVLTTMATAEYIEPDQKGADREIVKGLGLYLLVDHLHKYHQFTGVVRVAYQVTQAY